MKKFFKDTRKVLLTIFIVTASLLYVLIFDGSEIPFLITFMACIVILFLKAVKTLINTIRVFIYLKKSGMITEEDKEENVFWRIQTGRSIVLFLIAGWLLANLIYIYMGGI